MVKAILKHSDNLVKWNLFQPAVPQENFSSSPLNDSQRRLTTTSSPAASKKLRVIRSGEASLSSLTLDGNNGVSSSSSPVVFGSREQRVESREKNLATRYSLLATQEKASSPAKIVTPDKAISMLNGLPSTDNIVAVSSIGDISFSILLMIGHPDQEDYLDKIRHQSDFTHQEKEWFQSAASKGDFRDRKGFNDDIRALVKGLHISKEELLERLGISGDKEQAVIVGAHAPNPRLTLLHETTHALGVHAEGSMSTDIHEVLALFLVMMFVPYAQISLFQVFALRAWK
jgi:hypothetical protein